MTTHLLECSFLAIWLVFFGSSQTALAAGPPITFDSDAVEVQLFHEAGVGGKVNKQFLVTAKGATAVAQVYGSVTGVLLQATGHPDFKQRSRPINLSYKHKGDHDAVLHVSIGGSEVTSDIPAWVWAIAARFANHDATAAITMIDDPVTPSEKMFRERWLANADSNGRLLWVRYHPAVDDTLIGFFLFSADAMLADAESVRLMTDGLSNFDQFSGYQVMVDRAASRQAARTLNGLLALESKPGTTAMLNDLNEDFPFSIANGELQIGGSPRYRFARRGEGSGFTEAQELTAMFRKNRQLVSNVNPLVYTVVADFARLVAFFNYVDRTDPDELDEFVSGLKPVLDRIPTIDTPVAVALRAR